MPLLPSVSIRAATWRVWPLSAVSLPLCATPLHGDLEILQGTEDMKKAFRQVPLQDTRLRFAVIALWSPLLSMWVYAQLRAMPFGLMGAVLDINRVSGALEALSRRWFGVPVLRLLR